MEVNGRMLQIIELLFAGDGCVSIEDAQRRLACSQRSLLYNIDKVNAFFEEIGVSLITRHRGMMEWDVAQWDVVKSNLLQQEGRNYILSRAERKAVILIRIATAYHPVTIELLCTLFDISRNTIIAEIKELKQELAEIGVELTSAGRDGYLLVGDEISIRFKTMEAVHSLGAEHLQRFVQQMLLEAAEQFTHRELDRDAVKQMSGIVAACEERIQVKYNYNSINEAVSYLLLIAIRAGKGTRVSAYMEEIEPCPEYDAAGIIIQQMAEMGISIPVEEQSYITAVLLASKLYDSERRAADDLVDLQGFVSEFVDVFSAKACVQFQNREELVRRLLVHVRPMYYRLRYRIKVRNVLAEEIRKRYSGLYKLTEMSVRAVEGRYGIYVTTEEIAYLCVYIAGWVDERSLLEPEMDSNTIVIVCGAGIGTSLLLRSQLMTLLGGDFNYRIMDERDAVSQPLDSCALVVSAVELAAVPHNYIKVDPILTRSQQRKIIAWSLGHKGSEHAKRVDELLDIIEEHAEIGDRDALAFSLMRYLTGGNAELPSAELSLDNALTPGHLQILDGEYSSEAAFRAACRPLVESGTVDSHYHRSIEEIVDQLGLYYEIAPHILLAHGKKEEGVMHTGIALTLFRQPVVFPKWDKEASAVFVLAATDNESHLMILEDIMRLVQSPTACQRLVSGDFANEQELGEYIKTLVRQENS